MSVKPDRGPVPVNRPEIFNTRPESLGFGARLELDDSSVVVEKPFVWELGFESFLSGQGADRGLDSHLQKK